MSNKSGNFKGEINVSEMEGDKMNELEKRIEALEKQLASMQLTSCELDVINKELRKNALLIENLKLTLTSTKDKL
ncbi:hypothetical protein [Proteus mirabilis]|uniref:hypothetical protein n=1 Tax=Proteus mirabilis TaxID=584 RepID=UPI002551E068|nr:hypothetical protein [Proteus mirabilis]MDK6707920.1 hypothetical protein [Proteus mirabilis]